MKKLILTSLLVVLGVAAQAGGYRYFGHHYYSSPRISFFWGGGYPYYSPWSAYSYSYYPSYGYDYVYTRPNYAVDSTLTGALVGGIIGDSIHHQGWQGAGIGAAAGLVLGSLAEHNARVYERSYYTAPTVSYAQPNYIANAPTVNTAPTIPDAPRVPSAGTSRPASAMGGANSLFGR